MPPRAAAGATATKTSRGGRGHGGKSTTAAAAPPLDAPDLPITPAIADPGNAAACVRQPLIAGAIAPPPVTPPRIFAVPQYVPPAHPERPSSPGKEFASTPPCSDSEDDTIIGSQSKTRRQTPIIISPVKKKCALLGITKLTDLEVWNMPDEEIIHMHIFCFIKSNNY